MIIWTHTMASGTASIPSSGGILDNYSIVPI